LKPSILEIVMHHFSIEKKLMPEIILMYLKDIAMYPPFSKHTHEEGRG